jgi:hypothetical protein
MTQTLYAHMNKIKIKKKKKTVGEEDISGGRSWVRLTGF